MMTDADDVNVDYASGRIAAHRNIIWGFSSSSFFWVLIWNRGTASVALALSVSFLLH